MPTAEPTVAAMAAARSIKGGQIATSACAAPATSGKNFSKNAVVSAGVLNIFQLPAMIGFRIEIPV